MVLKWNIELISQPGRHLMYVGDIPGPMSSKKLSVPRISQPSVRRLPRMISQPLGYEKSHVISIQTETVELPHETHKAF